MLTNLTTEERFLYLLYWLTTFLHLLSIVIMFSCFGRGTTILAILTGIISLVWHITNLILYFTSNANVNDYPIGDAVMYWAELVINLILVAACLQILIKVDYVPMTPEEIEKVEVQELNHRMELKHQQRMMKQKKA